MEREFWCQQSKTDQSTGLTFCNLNIKLFGLDFCALFFSFGCGGTQLSNQLYLCVCVCSSSLSRRFSFSFKVSINKNWLVIYAVLRRTKPLYHNNVVQVIRHDTIRTWRHEHDVVCPSIFWSVTCSTSHGPYFLECPCFLD